MSIHVNVGGQNKKTSSAWMKINGEWKKGVFWNNVNGEWKKHSYSGFKYLASLISSSFYIPRKITLFEPKTTTIIADIPISDMSFSTFPETTFYNPYSNTMLSREGNGVNNFHEVDLTGTVIRKIPFSIYRPLIYDALSATRYIVKSFNNINTIHLIDMTTGALVKSKTFEVGSSAAKTRVIDVKVDKKNNRIHIVVTGEFTGETADGEPITYDKGFYTQLDLEFNTILKETELSLNIGSSFNSLLSVVPNGCVIAGVNQMRFCSNSGVLSQAINIQPAPTTYIIIQCTGLPDGNWLQVITVKDNSNYKYTCSINKFNPSGQLLLANSFQYQGEYSGRKYVIVEPVVLDSSTLLIRKFYRSDFYDSRDGYYAVVNLKDLSLTKLNTAPFFVKDNYTDMYGCCTNNGNLFANPETF